MELVQRLPFVLSALMAIVIGIISYINSQNVQGTYISMIIGMIIFFIIGIIIRSALFNIKDELDKKLEEERIKEQELLKMKTSDNAAAQETSQNSSVLDLKADDNTEKYLYDEEFSPLKVGEVYKTRAR